MVQWRAAALAMALVLAQPAFGWSAPRGDAVFGFGGVLLGGFSQSRWASACDVQKSPALRRLRVWGGHQWRLYGFSGPQGEGIVSAIHQDHPEEFARQIEEMPFGQVPNLTFDIHRPEGVLHPGSALLAIDCAWDPMPRRAEVLPASDAASRAAVQGWLRSKGLDAEDPCIVQSFLCDLDGDGELEHIVSAQNVLGPDAGLDWKPDTPFVPPAAGLMPHAERGRYSVLLVRQGTGRVDVLHEYVSEGGHDKFAFFYKIQLFADLNGDGRLEIVAGAACCEGLEYQVFAAGGEKTALVLSSAEEGRAPAGLQEESGAGPAGDAEAVRARRLAEAGDAAKANALGTWYEKGKHGLPRDGREAFAWYAKAARLGSGLALHNMGDCYRDGIGVPRDREKELACYLACAAQGLAIGYEDVGDALLRKAPAELDADAGTAAVRWYAKAAAHGRKGAAEKLRRMGRPVPSQSASALPACRGGKFDLAAAECRRSPR